MKILIACITALVICQSCNTRKEQSREIKSFFKKCDELNIVFYSKDSFAFKTVDTLTIKTFTKFIIGYNDNDLPDSKQQPKEQLIYKSKGKIFFTTNIFEYSDEKGNMAAYASYTLQGKKIKHLLTYSIGMGIDGIYNHKINPDGNPWADVDSTKFHYEDLGKLDKFEIAK